MRAMAEVAASNEAGWPLFRAHITRDFESHLVSIYYFTC